MSSPPYPALPRLPRDEAGPVFAEPWEAEAFALAVQLSASGYFTWTEWSIALGEELGASLECDATAANSSYYRCWLAALERLVVAKSLSDAAALAARKEAWASAYGNTPHGVAVELNPRVD
jgi:nitrile hydratase accessory protein